MVWSTSRKGRLRELRQDFLISLPSPRVHPAVVCLQGRTTSPRPKLRFCTWAAYFPNKSSFGYPLAIPGPFTLNEVSLDPLGSLRVASSVRCGSSSRFARAMRYSERCPSHCLCWAGIAVLVGFAALDLCRCCSSRCRCCNSFPFCIDLPCVYAYATCFLNRY